MNIADFARAGQISVRMLRHYHQIGLLTPVHVDPVTGYRTYGSEQRHDLHRLLALKTLGFTLAEVGKLLHLGPDRRDAGARIEPLFIRAADAADDAKIERRACNAGGGRNRTTTAKRPGCMKHPGRRCGSQSPVGSPSPVMP